MPKHGYHTNTHTCACTHTYRSEYRGERVPTLDEAVNLCEELELLLFLDLKGDAGDVEKVNKPQVDQAIGRNHLAHH